MFLNSKSWNLVYRPDPDTFYADPDPGSHADPDPTSLPVHTSNNYRFVIPGPNADLEYGTAKMKKGGNNTIPFLGPGRLLLGGGFVVQRILEASMLRILSPVI